SDFTHGLRARTENSVNIGIVREKKEQTLTLTLPPKKETGWMDDTAEVPELDVETRVELGDLSQELAALRPQIEFAVNQSTMDLQKLSPAVNEEIRKAMEEGRKAGEQARKDLQAHGGAMG